MAIYRLGDDSPLIAETAYLATEATVIGRVTLEPDVSIWPNAVLRGDTEPIHVGEGSNVQDGAVLHADPGFPLSLGANVTVGHQATLHGCTVGAGSLVGIQAVVLNGAAIGRHCLVAAGSVITEGKKFRDGSLILGTPAKVIRDLSEDEVARILGTAKRYVARGQDYRRRLHRVD